MTKKKEIPTSNPAQKQTTDSGGDAQRGSTRTRGDIKKIETDYTNPNGGPQQRSQKKS